MAGGVALVSPVMAADVTPGFGSLKDVPFVAPVVTPPWAGFYAGLHVGGIVQDDSSVDVERYKLKEDAHEYLFKKPLDPHEPGFLDQFAIFDDDDDGSVIGGVHIGYNWQRPDSLFVAGIEADLDFADRIDYLATLRGRIGLGLDRFLIYATAGVAFAGFDDRRFDVMYIGDEDFMRQDHHDDDDETQVGFVAGLGAEVKLAQNVSLGIEGLYYDFDDDNGDSVKFVRDFASLEDSPGDEVAVFSSNRDKSFWQIRGRLTYHVNQPFAPLR